MNPKIHHSKAIKLPTPPTLHLPNYFAKNES
jgi:hypothetical protein